MASRDSSPRDAAYWYVPLARAIPAAALAVVITFSQDHSPRLGLLSFGGFAVLTGLAVSLLSARLMTRSLERSLFLGHGIISVLAGAAALVLPGGGLSYLIFLVSLWAALTGFLELYAGFRSRGRNTSSRDWMFIGGLTVVFAIVTLLMPPDMVQQFSGENGVSGVLSSSIIVVGILGAYGAICAVYLVIGGLSLKWAPASVTQDGTAS
jgi:uncharacterized membrane protein HdeD (DUF308 family)